MIKKIILSFCFAAVFSLAQSYDLPIIFVDTKAQCLDYKNTEKIPATMLSATMRVLDGAVNNVADSANGKLYDIGIKIRGHESARFPKPGYSVEIRDSQGKGLDASLFGLPPSDDWIFHGPYVDKSLMRNSLAHWLFRQTGRYSPRTRHFDLYINGMYRGVYVLIEKIKRGKYRVDVDKLDETDVSGDDVTGGYIWSIDKVKSATGGKAFNNDGFTTSDGLDVFLRYPKKTKIQPEQEEYLKNYLNNLESLAKNDSNSFKYEKYVDVASAVDYVLHEEMMDNIDAYTSAFFFYKQKESNGGKVNFGPPWDFNLALNNVFEPKNSEMNSVGFGGKSGWRIEEIAKMNQSILMTNFGSPLTPTWFIQMWKDADYQSELKKRWAELRSGVWHTNTLDAYLDSMKTYLKNAADRNFKRWPNLGKISGECDEDPEPMKNCERISSCNALVVMSIGGNNADTWDGEVEYLRKKMKERIAWMDEQLGFTEPAAPIVTEPVIHDPDWQKDEKVDSIPKESAISDFDRLSPTKFIVVNGDRIDVQTDIGGDFALVDLNGVVLYKTRIKMGFTTLKIPSKAKSRRWIATLNGKKLSK